jgi:Ca2+-transporting ATPase
MPAQMPDTLSFSGLKKSEIQPLLKQFGRNIFKQDKQNGFLFAVWNIIKEPMFLMLVVASSLYFVLCESSEGLLMLLAMSFVVTISIYQETKSSRALQALKEFTQSKVTVIRDNKKESVFAEELVPVMS